MAVAYARVLQDRGDQVTVIGRGPQSAARFESETGIPVRTGGLDALADGALATMPVIIAASVEQLGMATESAIGKGARRLLVEKPAGLGPAEVDRLAERARQSGAAVFVAYNRRFNAATLKAREMLAAAGGATSLRMEFSEYSHKIAPLQKAPGVKEAWLYANSTHVLDLGFHLAGFPADLATFSTGQLDWHPDGAIFSGAGRTETGALFAYTADWTSAPRWSVEVAARGLTLTLQPLETLRIRRESGFGEESVAIDDALDRNFKPGIWRQLDAFLSDSPETTPLLSLDEQCRIMSDIYTPILSGSRS
jgi:predicted dehydrogenase